MAGLMGFGFRLTRLAQPFCKKCAAIVSSSTAAYSRQAGSTRGARFFEPAAAPHLDPANVGSLGPGVVGRASFSASASWASAPRLG